MHSTQGPSTLFVALALAALLILEPSANAAVHRLTSTLTYFPLRVSSTPSSKMTPLDQLVSHKGLAWTMAREQRRLQQVQQKTTACDSDSQGSGSGVANVTMEYGYIFAVDMDIGTPAQGPFEMEFDFTAQQTYVLKKGAKYSDDGSKVKNVQEYNKKTSTTALQQNANFIPCYSYKSGSVVSDTLQIGSLSTNQSVQVTTKLDSGYDNYGGLTDGNLGLGVSDARDGSSFVEQLASQLDSPVLTLYANKSYGFADGTGLLSFGDRLPETCVASSWMKMQSTSDSHYPAVDTASVTGPATSDGCENKVTANITVGFSNYIMPIYASVQVQQVFVKASGAQWVGGVYEFVVDDVSKAATVQFHNANGDVVLELTPNDYLIEIGGIQHLYIYGFYDQDTIVNGDYIVLGQNFMNNHCLSMDMTSGEWSLADATSLSELVVSSSSSSSSDTDTESQYGDDDGNYGDDYINRKH